MAIQLPNPQALPGGSIANYTFQSGPFAGMTMTQVQQYLNNYRNSVQEQFGQKPPKTVTGSSSTDTAAGYLAGIGGAALGQYGIKQGINALSSSGAATGAGATSTTGAAASSAPVATSINGGTVLANGTVQGGTAAGTAGSTTASTGTTGTSALGALATPLSVAAGAYGTYQGINSVRDNLSDGVSSGDNAQLGAVASSPLGFYQTGTVAPLSQAAGVNAQDANNAIAYGNYAGAAQTGGAAAGLSATATANSWNPYGWALAAYLGGTQALGIDPFLGSKVKAERVARQKGRNAFQDVGLMSKDSRSHYNLADGSQFGIVDYREKNDKHAYNIDFDEEGAGDKAGALNPLTYALFGSNKLNSDMTGELYNAYNSNGDFNRNIMTAYNQMGGRGAVYQGVAEAWKKGRINADERDSAFAAIDKQYGVKNESGARWDGLAGLDAKAQKRNVEELAAAEQRKVEEAKKKSKEIEKKI